ncbi:MAG: dCMP deaminase family protein [Firmicutes bacterium]|nr:dCMP deaminase family protein [Bacillota bacterium]
MESVDSMFNSRPGWDEYFMFIAKVAASRSTCMSRPVGGILVIDRQILVSGYNGSMPGEKHCIDSGKCFRRTVGKKGESKYDYCLASHAEANLLAQAAKKGIRVEGATLYITLAPCYTCAKQLAVAGIKDIVFEHTYESDDKHRDDFWHKSISNHFNMRKLVISQESVNYIEKDFIADVTSRRRLG